MIWLEQQQQLPVVLVFSSNILFLLTFQDLISSEEEVEIKRENPKRKFLLNTDARPLKKQKFAEFSEEEEREVRPLLIGMFGLLFLELSNLLRNLNYPPTKLDTIGKAYC